MMLPILSRHLAVVVCLALQVMATPCMSCPCRQGEGENEHRQQVATSPSKPVGAAETTCGFCEAASAIRKPYRCGPRDRQVRLLAVTTQEPLLLLDETILSGIHSLRRFVLLSTDVHELQVLLE